jgi:hypothetical protein
VARTAQTSKENGMKVSQSGNFKNFKSAGARPIKRYDETGFHEQRHIKGRPRVTSAAEDKFIRVKSLRNYNPNKCFIVQVTDTSQHQCVNQAFIVELLQRNYY